MLFLLIRNYVCWLICPTFLNFIAFFDFHCFSVGLSVSSNLVILPLYFLISQLFSFAWYLFLLFCSYYLKITRITGTDIRVSSSYLSPSFWYSPISSFWCELPYHNRTLLRTKSRGITNRMRIFVIHKCYMLRSYSYIRFIFVHLADVTVGLYAKWWQKYALKKCNSILYICRDLHSYHSEETGGWKKISHWVASQYIFVSRYH